MTALALSTVGGVTMVRIHAAPGRTYPHPGGHSAGRVRFVGRGPVDLSKDQFDVDGRFPILADGELMPLDADMTRAIEHGDLLASSSIPTPAPEVTIEAPVAPAAPTVIHTDANMVGEVIARTAPAAPEHE